MDLLQRPSYHLRLRLFCMFDKKNCYFSSYWFLHLLIIFVHTSSRGVFRRRQWVQFTLSLCQPEIPYEYYIHEFLIFCSSYMYKSVERKKIDFSRWPFKGRTDMHQKIQPDGLTGWCRLACNSEGHRENSFFSSLTLF